MNKAFKIWLSVLFLLLSTDVKPAPFDTGMITLSQPNDVTFTGRIWGDEFIYWAETQDGYRFVQSGDGWYYYATLNSHGEFSATTYKVGIDTPPASSYQLERTQARLDEIHIQIEQFNAQVELNRQWYAQKQAEADAQGQPSVNLKVGIILIEFQDVKHFKTTDPNNNYRPNGYYKSDFENMMFSDNYWTDPDLHPEGEQIFGSFRDYWYQMSKAKLRVGGQVVNPQDPEHPDVPKWLTANNNRSYYTDTYAGITILGNEAIQKAIDSGYISTSQGDTNYYDNLTIIYAQNPIVGTSTTVGGYPNTNWYILGEQMGSEVYGQNKSFTHIGLNLTCFGTNIGFYDGNTTYGYTNPTPTYNFNLMDGGSSNGPNRKGECPATLAPYFRIQKGWIEPIPIPSDTNNFLVEYDYQNPKFYKIDPIIGPQDMNYLFEVRKREGFDAYIPAPPDTYQNQLGTLLIWQHNVEISFNGEPQIDKLRLKLADYIYNSLTQLTDFFPSAGYNNYQSLNDTTLPAASIGNTYDEYSGSVVVPAHFALNGIEKLTNGNTMISEIKLNHAIVKNQNAGNWQTMSVPVGYNNYSLSKIFPTALFAYKFVNNTYTPVDTLTNGLGYWVYFPNQNQNLVNVGTVVEHLEIPVSTGWNIIGTISNKLPLPNVCIRPPEILNSIWRYITDVGYQLVQQSDSLIPGIGYWTLTNGSGYVILDWNTGPCQLSKITFLPQINLQTLDKFIITDSEGSSQSLYVSNIDIDTSLANININLPPMFPEMDFDSRFEYNEFVKRVSADSGTIDLNILVHANSFPISLEWEINPANGINYSFISDSGLGKISNINSSKGKTSFNNLSNNKIQLFAIADKINSSANQPSEYTLEQNYPNPFNPSTNIKYALKNDGRVTLKIYNVLGEEVSTLVDEVKSAGAYQVKFTARELSSGVYIYKLQSGDYIQSRKMILLK